MGPARNPDVCICPSSHGCSPSGRRRCRGCPCIDLCLSRWFCLSGAAGAGMEGSIWSGVPGTLMSAPSPIHRGLSLGASGQESPPHHRTPPAPPARLTPPYSLGHGTPPAPFGTPRSPGLPADGKDATARVRVPPGPCLPWKGARLPYEAPPRGVFPFLRIGLAIAPGQGGRDRHSRRQGAIGSKAGCPPGTSCLSMEVIRVAL